MKISSQDLKISSFRRKSQGLKCQRSSHPKGAAGFGDSSSALIPLGTELDLTPAPLNLFHTSTELAKPFAPFPGPAGHKSLCPQCGNVPSCPSLPCLPGQPAWMPCCLSELLQLRIINKFLNGRIFFKPALCCLPGNAEPTSCPPAAPGSPET